MQNFKEIGRMTVQRSHIHSVCCIKADGTPYTWLEWVKAEPSMYHRNDIFMLYASFKCECCGELTKARQLWVYPHKDGTISGDAVEYLTPTEKQWCLDETAKLIELSKQYPEVNKLLI